MGETRGNADTASGHNWKAPDRPCRWASVAHQALPVACPAAAGPTMAMVVAATS